MQSEKRGKDEASVAIDGSTQLVQAGLTAPAAIAKQAKSANSAKSVSSLWVLLMTNLQGFADHGVLACQIVTGHKPKDAPVVGRIMTKALKEPSATQTEPVSSIQRTGKPSHP